MLLSKANDTQYFKFNIQTENDFLQGLCYTPYFLRDISQKQEVQKPIKLTNYSVKENNLKANSFSILFPEEQRLKILKNVLLNTKRTELIMKIIDINNVPDFDTISTVGKVHVTSQPKRIKLTMVEKCVN